MEDLKSENEHDFLPQEEISETNTDISDENFPEYDDTYDDIETAHLNEEKGRVSKLKRLALSVKKNIGYDKKNKKFFVGRVRIGRTLAIVLLIIIVIICAFVGCTSHAKKKMMQAMVPKDVTVERRTVTKKVTGSSTIEPKDSYSIMTITTGEITADFINEGDTVQKGDKLYQFDSETPQNSVSTAENALKKAQQGYLDAVKTKSQTSKTNDKNVKSAQIAVERAKQGYSDAQKTLGDLNVKSDISGTVSEVYVKEGDSVQAGGKIASVYNDRYMKIQLPFNENDAQYISVGDGATVTVAGTGNELWGSVSSVSSSSVATNGHNIVKYVTIEVENPGALTTADKGTAQIGDVACNDAVQFEYINEHTISAEASGKIVKLNISKNDAVYNGQSIASLDSTSVSSSANTAKLSLDDAVLALEKAVLASDEYSQDSAINNARLALDDARLGLEKAQKGLDDYTITAPIAGTVVTKNNKAGDKIDSSNATTPMCIIYDMSSMQFDINVDEIDVAKVKTGQEVKITADAVADKEFKGVVEKVSVNGVAENGVTNYPVTISITDYGELLPGMNVDAEIVVQKADNVLAVPVSSLNRGNTVYVKGDKEDKNDSAPEGYRTVEVETGLSDDDYIEIKSGLSEGELVRGQEIDMSSDLQKMMEQQMNGAHEQMQGGGSPGGGAPGGGAPGGGGGAPGGM